MKLHIYTIAFCTALFAANCSSNSSGTGSTETASSTGGSTSAAATEGSVTLQMPKYFNGAAFTLNTSYTTAGGKYDYDRRSALLGFEREIYQG